MKKACIHSLLLLASASAAACDGNNNMTDASDAATDVRTDGGSNDGSDIGSDVSADTGADTGEMDVAMTDGSGDSAITCSATPLTPNEYITASGWNNNVNITINDATGIGGGNNLVIVSAINRVPDMGMLQTMGDCTQIPMPNFERFTAPDIDLGTMTITENTQMGQFVYDSTMNNYAPMGFDSWMMTEGHPISLGIANLDGGLTSTTIPAFLRSADISATFTDAAAPVLSRTTDTVVTFTPSAEQDLIFSMFIFSQSAIVDHPLWCGVRACSGRLTIPAAFVSAWAEGTTIQLQPSVTRVAHVAGTTPGLDFVVGSSVLYAAAAQ